MSLTRCNFVHGQTHSRAGVDASRDVFLGFYESRVQGEGRMTRLRKCVLSEPCTKYEKGLISALVMASFSKRGAGRARCFLRGPAGMGGDVLREGDVSECLAAVSGWKGMPVCSLRRNRESKSSPAQYWRCSDNVSAGGGVQRKLCPPYTGRWWIGVTGVEVQGGSDVDQNKPQDAWTTLRRAAHSAWAKALLPYCERRLAESVNCTMNMIGCW